MAELRARAAHGRAAGRSASPPIASASRSRPTFGEAYWSLANLKTFRFSPTRRRGDAQGSSSVRDLNDDDRYHLHFSLGKALEDAGEYAASFSHYDQGNRLRRASVNYSAEERRRICERSKALFTRDFFASARGRGRARRRSDLHRRLAARGLDADRADPVEPFSQVEGTMELARHRRMLARELERAEARSRKRRSIRTVLARLGRRTSCGRSGEEYLARTRIQRKTGRPFFIDKMPNNFAHLGMIHLILPNAKIIDARRHPMGNCFSAFKQHFARGQTFSYSLDELAATTATMSS